jgi:RNase P/RNase MRP subunit POP5
MVRFKNRYILAEINWKIHTEEHAKLSSQQINRAIRNFAFDFCGEIGYAFIVSSLQSKYYII